MASLSDDRVREFLTYGTRTGKLAFVASDGRPVVVPIWFLVEGEEIVFTTGADTAKAKAFARDPRAALCVDLEDPPYAFVQIQGTVTTSEEPGELLRTATALGARYMGPDRAEEFGRRNGVPGELVVRLRPAKVMAAFDVTA
ncbi:PPOX class F420-dependent oxidoreductase [Nocardia shimofusensis]|uniref:PPOX class F420-dependent oxidoreductase n=1 Tax=Nocardia shimofusensis TaxID=228596 RepID=UPI0008309049|nr:PPOX class F420-dependent oxidoreductase [Nocardia shimofusensis]